MAGQWLTWETLVEITGREAAAALCAHCGGVRVYVPKTASASTALGRIVGLEAATALAALYGGEEIVPPNRRRVPAKGEIIALLEQGLSLRAVALRLDVTQRYVEHVAQLTRPRPVQGSLLC